MTESLNVRLERDKRGIDEIVPKEMCVNIVSNTRNKNTHSKETFVFTIKTEK